MLAEFIAIIEVGDKWRLVIPKEIRKDLNLKYKNPMAIYYNFKTKQILVETAEKVLKPRNMPAKAEPGPQRTLQLPNPEKAGKTGGVIT